MRPADKRDVPESPFLWARGIAARETLGYLDKNGIDAEPLLSSAGLSRSQLSQQRRGVSVASQCRFLELAAAETNNSLLGLHVAAEMDLRDGGVLFYLMASSVTVAEALEHLAKYAATTNEAVRIEISRHNLETVLTAHFLLGVEEPRRQASEFLALAVIRALHRETNRDLVPSRVTFVHARNSDLREIHHLLGCPVEFAHGHRQLGVPAKRHGAADHFSGQPPVADFEGACGRSALREAYVSRPAGLGGKPPPECPSQRQGAGSSSRPTARHERALIYAASRSGGHHLRRDPRPPAEPPRSSLSRRSGYVAPTDRLAARLFRACRVQSRIQAVVWHVAK